MVTRHLKRRLLFAATQVGLLVLLAGSGRPAMVAAQADWPTPGVVVAGAALDGTGLVALLLLKHSEAIYPTRLALVDTLSGRAVSQVEVPSVGLQVAVDAQGQRVYLATAAGSGEPRSLAIYDRASATLQTVALPPPFVASGVVFNPVTRRVYVNGEVPIGGGRFGVTARSFSATGQPIGELPFQILAVDAGLNRLYARADLLDTPGPRTGSRFLALDATSERPETAAGFLDLPEGWPTDGPRAMQVNRFTHRVYLHAWVRGPRETEARVLAFDGRRLATSPPEVVGFPVSPVEVLALNEATDRLYISGHPWHFIMTNQGPQWHTSAGRPIAADPLLNRLYLIQPARPGAALMLVDGRTDVVIGVRPLVTGDPPEPVRRQPPPRDGERRYFPETGHTLGGVFRAYWDEHGGLAIFGYPLTEAFQPAGPWPLPAGYQGQMVQYFERAVLEYTPAFHEGPATLHLQLVGLRFAALQPRVTPSGPSGPERRFFPETGHTLAYGFKTLWEQRGGLAIFGYPITEEFSQVSPTDGRIYTVQYFERARFEYHPEHAGTPHEVQLGQLGWQALATGGLPPMAGSSP